MPYPAEWAIQEALIEHHLSFKHRAFAEEHEWRLIKMVDMSAEVRLRQEQESEAVFAEMDREMREHLGAATPAPTPRVPRPTNAEGIEIRFRPTPRGLIPFVDLKLRNRVGSSARMFPLAEVVHGPSEHPDLSLESLRMYLDSKGFVRFHTEVRTSIVPLRQ